MCERCNCNFKGAVSDIVLLLKGLSATYLYYQRDYERCNCIIKGNVSDIVVLLKGLSAIY